jgi:hypothetical protein
MSWVSGWQAVDVRAPVMVLLARPATSSCCRHHVQNAHLVPLVGTAPTHHPPSRGTSHSRDLTVTFKLLRILDVPASRVQGKYSWSA